MCASLRCVSYAARCLATTATGAVSAVSWRLAEVAAPAVSAGLAELKKLTEQQPQQRAMYIRERADKIVPPRWAHSPPCSLLHTWSPSQAERENSLVAAAITPMRRAAPDRPPPSRRCAAIAIKGLAAYHRFNWSHLGLFKDINRSFFLCNWERYYLYTWSWIIDNRSGGTYRYSGNSSPITFGRYIYKFQSLNRLAQIWLENVPPACIKHPTKLASDRLTKGQLISKCPFGVSVWTKIPTKKFDNFCPRI